MIRVRRDPIWLLLILVPILAWLWFAYPNQRGWLQIVGVGLGIYVVLRVGFWALTLLSRPPVPNSAARELVERCTGEQTEQEWTLVKFRPAVTLEEARRKVGSASYSEEDRLHGFMTKFQFAAPSRPDVAVFHSAEKGYLLGRTEVIRALEKRYGRWMLDTWYSLRGALLKNNMQDCSLDGGQLFYRGRHMGSTSG